MSKQVQAKRGTATQNDALTGAVGEVTVDTTNDSLRVHDGSTAGGIQTMRVDMANYNGTRVSGTFNVTALDASGSATMADLDLSDNNIRLQFIETDTTDLNTRIQHNAGIWRLQTLNDSGSTVTNRLLIDHSTGDIS